MLKKLLLLHFAFFILHFSFSQEINPKLLTNHWQASWIADPDAAPRDYGIYHFRKKINLDKIPSTFVVHASGDNRYRLFINGTPVCSGPARGDLYNWYFETVDIAPYLKKGDNIIAALVWNMGIHAPVAQISNQTAFVLQGNSKEEEVVNTNSTWKVYHNASYSPVSTDNGQRMRSYMVVGPGDKVDASTYPWGWEKIDYNDDAWKKPKSISNPIATGYGTDNIWTLKQRTIPLMFERMQRIPNVRKAVGVQASNSFLLGAQPLTIPAHTTATILLDQTFNTVAYPELEVSQGKGSEIKLTYAEALMTPNWEKGNRNEIEGKNMIGNYDIFLPDGGDKRHFRSLWFRTYRYMQLEVKTGNQPLTINDIYGSATGYPFEVKASFKSNDQSMQDIWNVGWRTAQLCAGETYFDCPYYEQLQYEGDTRIQSLISLYVTGDDRLMKKAITDFYQSRVPEGLTQGRYPSSRLQVIPPFSLFWVSMIYDHWMHRNDNAFISNFIIPVMGVLDWYEKRIDREKKMLGPMKWWNFVDWNLKFPGGTPDGANDGNSAVLTFQYVYTLRQAADLFDYFGKKYEAAHYRQVANELGASAYAKCFDASKGVIANTPDKKAFSQHASIMAVLSGSVPTEKQSLVMKNVLNDTSLSQATFYYRFYLNRALNKVGMADRYYGQLTPWRDMIANGLTTFAENPDPTRSDCHAWSSSPNYDFLATICGIMPSKPGFSEVRIAPALGELTEAEGTMPHPNGTITVKLKRINATGINATIQLPKDVKGEFVWKGKVVKLNGGEQRLRL